MNILVTGGAGFVGATTTATLLDADHRVTVVDDLSTGHADAVPSGARLVVGDFRDREVLDEALTEDIDACIHFAALIEAGESMKRPEDFFAMNTAGSAVLLQRLRVSGVERFVLSSTAAVYGDPESTPIEEDATVRPTNAYGESKLMVERMLDWLHELRGLKIAVLRYFNAAGATPGRPERHNPETHLIPIVLQVARGEREAVALFGTDYPTTDGTAIRDYVHVQDLADAHVAAVERLDEHTRLVCNLGSGVGASVRQIISAAREVTGHPIPVVDEGRRTGDPAVLVASNDRAKALLGWVPSRSDVLGMVHDAWRMMS
jgi:UDP-glucose 4-epimerase